MSRIVREPSKFTRRKIAETVVTSPKTSKVNTSLSTSKIIREQSRFNKSSEVMTDRSRSPGRLSSGNKSRSPSPKRFPQFKEIEDTFKNRKRGQNPIFQQLATKHLPKSIRTSKDFLEQDSDLKDYIRYLYSVNNFTLADLIIPFLNRRIHPEELIIDFNNFGLIEQISNKYGLYNLAPFENYLNTLSFADRKQYFNDMVKHAKTTKFAQDISKLLREYNFKLTQYDMRKLRDLLREYNYELTQQDMREFQNRQFSKK